jgi:hypothetical protein
MHAHWNECEFKIWNFKCFSTLLKYSRNGPGNFFDSKQKFRLWIGGHESRELVFCIYYALRARCYFRSLFSHFSSKLAHSLKAPRDKLTQLTCLFHSLKNDVWKFLATFIATHINHHEYRAILEARLVYKLKYFT